MAPVSSAALPTVLVNWEADLGAATRVLRRHDIGLSLLQSSERWWELEPSSEVRMHGTAMGTLPPGESAVIRRECAPGDAVFVMPATQLHSHQVPPGKDQHIET